MARWLSWRRLIFLFAVIVAASWIFGPAHRRKEVFDYVKDKSQEALEKGPAALNDFNPFKHYSGGPASNIDLDKLARQRPSLHSDPLKTTRCETPRGNWMDSKGKERPLIQYATMIDAGSTGSRVHVYKFNFCEKAPELEDEFFDKVQGGLSLYAGNPRAAAESLRPLLEAAQHRIPQNLRSCAPIVVKATAGLRLLGAEQSDAILSEVRKMLETEFPFPIADGRDPTSKKGVEIMDGKDEGVYAWITVNYLLNRIGSSTAVAGLASGDRTRTAAVMDLGGASTQIVFEPVFKSATQGMYPGEHVYELKDFGAKPYTLYQNSYLGFGLMQARNSINSLAAYVWSIAHPQALRKGAAKAGLEEGAVVPHPCFAKDRTKTIESQSPSSGLPHSLTFKGTGAGFDACRRLVEVMMDKDATCQHEPCSFAGVYQPSLMSTFAEAPIVALSYFYDRFEPLGYRSSITIGQLARLAKDVCKPPDTWPARFPLDKYPNALTELEDRPETCLDLTFMHGLLSLGYELSESRSITIAKKLAGTELGWALGAQLAVLEEGNLCRMR